MQQFASASGGSLIASSRSASIASQCDVVARLARSPARLALVGPWPPTPAKTAPYSAKLCSELGAGCLFLDVGRVHSQLLSTARRGGPARKVRDG
jgi:hypothetical protein